MPAFSGKSTTFCILLLKVWKRADCLLFICVSHSALDIFLHIGVNLFLPETLVAESFRTKYDWQSYYPGSLFFPHAPAPDGPSGYIQTPIKRISRIKRWISLPLQRWSCFLYRQCLVSIWTSSTCPLPCTPAMPKTVSHTKAYISDHFTPVRIGKCFLPAVPDPWMSFSCFMIELHPVQNLHNRLESFGQFFTVGYVSHGPSIYTGIMVTRSLISFYFGILWEINTIVCPCFFSSFSL